MRHARPFHSSLGSSLVLFPLVFGLALAAPAAGTAQTAESDGNTCVCFGQAGGELGARTWVNRARIGVFLGDAAEVDGRLGVRVDDVETDGPADRAGLEAGDVITAVEGTGLGDPPGRGLVMAIRELEPGDTVELTYYRDGDRRTADVVTTERHLFGTIAPGRFEFRGAQTDELRERLREFNIVTPGAYLRRLSPGGLGLVAVNPELGEYFGTDSGVLVTEMDDATLGLESGDVILSIDDREVRDPAHVRSILDSYRPDEEITFRVMRHERELTVTGTLGG